MSDIYRICPDALLYCYQNTWILTNPRLRRHIELNQKAISALTNCGQGRSKQLWIEALTDGSTAWNRTTPFFGSRGLHQDVSAFAAKRSDAELQGEALFDHLVHNFFIVEEGSVAYDSYLAPKTSLLDHNHLGTFHQNVGQYLTLQLRLKEKWRWWQDQKFNRDGTAVLPGPYQYIQEHFFDQYFGRQDLSGTQILDFGCGNGYFTAKLARQNAQLCGIDTSLTLIEQARQNYPGKAEFIHVDSAEEGLAALQAMPEACFDRIIMQDTLLLLVRPENVGSQPMGLETLRALCRLLKPDGLMHVTEPNPVFWLACRLGDPRRPMAVVTEYRQAVFNIVPTLEELLPIMTDAGFALVEFIHPRPSEVVPAGEEGNQMYTQNFAIWDFMTFIPSPVKALNRPKFHSEEIAGI